MSPKDIVGISDIALLCRVNKSTVCMWRKRYKDFPKPVKELKCGPVFNWNHIDKWLIKKEWFLV